RIINGVEVKPFFKYPWMAAIRRNGGSFCGGVLLSETYMITAAHCSKSGNNREFKILAHRHNLKMSNERENGFSLEVIKRTVHKEHDIAIWELEKNTNFRLNNKIRLAPLNDHSSVPGENSNKLVTALGWGWVKTGGPGSSTLMQVEVPLVEQSKCHKLWNKRGVDINIDTQVCAGWPEGRRDTCKGDSGGPLFYEEDGQYYLVGLTSFGDPCAKANTPTVYVRASYFESWIKEHSN
ncbi:trypsin-like serine protease, partial [Neoconidiobolus thromboides FSU 785]